ncbi:MAG: hypothetical protein R3F31_25955 [Verrucomicrobiales bacterium]
MKRPIAIAVLLATLGLVRGRSEEYFPLDSRSWSRTGEAIILTDLSQVKPSEALVTGKREKGKWKVIPFTTADLEGTALSVYGLTNPRSCGWRCRSGDLTPSTSDWPRRREDSTSAGMGSRRS